MASTSALLEAAYTNVSLLADAAWAPCSMGPMGVPLTGPTVDPSASVVNACGARAGVAFRRANQDLWLRCVHLDRYIRENQCVSPKGSNGNYLPASTHSMSSGQNNGWYRYKEPVSSEGKSGEKRPRTVKDTIPLSRLASYGGQVAYNEEREKLYTVDDGGIYALSPVPTMDSKIPDEPWLLSAVEEVFKRLTALPERAPRSQRKYEEYYGGSCGSSQGTSRCSSSELLQELTPQMRCPNGSVSREEIQLNSSQLQHKSEPHLSNVQRYTLTNHEEVRLQMKIRAPAVQDLWSKINNQVRLGQSFPQIQIQKARQMSHHNHQHGQHQQMLPSNGRLSRHRSLSRFPVLQMQNLQLPQLNAEVPEFYPKTNSGPPFGLLMGPGSSCSAGIADCGGINTSRLHNLGNAVTVLLPPANELAYQDELFPYRKERDNAHHHRLQAMDHVAGILARPPATGTLSMAPQTRANNPWFLSTTNSESKPNPTSLLPTGPPSMPLPPPPPAPPPPHKSLKATRHSTRNGKMQFQSIPIPVYQRPPEFYTQQNEAATNGNGTGGSIGTRRRTGGSGVDFSNLILLTRGGKGHNRHSTSSAPSTANVPSKTETLTSDTKSHSNRPVTSEGARNATEPTPTSLVHEIPSTQINQSSDDVFQWLNAAFGSGKSKNIPQVGGGQTTQTAALGVVGLPQDLAVTYPPRASADNYTDDNSTAGTRRRLYRDVLTHATCAASGEDTVATSSRTASPIPASSSSGDKFELLEEEALMQYKSSDDSLAERGPGQTLRKLDGGTPSQTCALTMSTSTSSTTTTSATTSSTTTTSTSAALTMTTSSTVALTAASTASTGTQPSAQSPTKQRRFKDQSGCKILSATPPPPPPAPPGDEVQSPRRRLYRDVLAHRRAGPSSETSGTVSGPRDSASWSDVLKRLEEQALMEYRLSDDVASTTRETSQRASEEALTRRYQDLERQALMQYLRSTSSNSEVQTCEGDSSNGHTQRGRSGVSSRSGMQCLHRMEEDVMVNLKLLQRERSRASPSKFQPNRSFNLQDNQTDKRVYRKQMTKKPFQPQTEVPVQQVQQVQHCNDTGSSNNKFVQMSAPQVPQLVHQQMVNNAEIEQRAHQQLLQEQLTLLHLNQQITQPAFEQQHLNPFHQLPQKMTPKPPQPEFCLHAQQNYHVCQQAAPQPTLQQPFSQLHVIELQQRLSHPGLSAQQVVELQTLYQHQTFSNPDIDFLNQHTTLKKQYPQKPTVPKVPLQKQTHRRQLSQPKIQQVENQEIQHLELQQQRMASQNVPLMLSLPQIVTPQSKLIEMQSRWQQINSYSCPSSPALQCGGPHLDPHGDMALGGVRPPGQLQGRPADVTSSLQVTDSTTSLISNPILTVEESSEQRNVALESAQLSTDTERKHVASTSQDPSPETSKDKPPKAPSPNEQKVTKKSGKKKKRQVNNHGGKKLQKKFNCFEVKTFNEDRKGTIRNKEKKEKLDTGSNSSKRSEDSDCKDYREKRLQSQARLTSLDPRRSRSCECLVQVSLHLTGNCDEIPLYSNNETRLRAEREQTRRDKVNT